jgi:hypothetical protein
VRAGLNFQSRRADKSRLKHVQSATSRRSADFAPKRRRRDDGASAFPRRRLDNFALVPSRWCLGVVKLVHRPRRAGASGLSTFSRWRVGIVALMHVGIVALRFGIAALARRERAPCFAARDGPSFSTVTGGIVTAFAYRPVPACE